jgi:hypothetical protein
MGTLRKYELKTTDCKVFFETGTGLGHSLSHALDNGNFDLLYSSEIHDVTANRAKDRFKKNKNVQILNMTSLDALKNVLINISSESPILFFLDAHFPGEVENDFSYSSNVPSSTSMPLKDELELISRFRKNSKDVIIVDDLKLYEDGPFANGSMVKGFANISEMHRSLEFIKDLYPEMMIHRNYQDDGYLIIHPKDLNFDLRKVSNVYRFKRQIKKNLRKILGNKPFANLS